MVSNEVVLGRMGRELEVLIIVKKRKLISLDMHSEIKNIISSI